MNTYDSSQEDKSNPETKKWHSKKSSVETVNSQQNNQMREWKSNTDYGFKNYEELVKNYAEVFEKKQKVKKSKKEEPREDFRADEREIIDEIYFEIK